MLPEDINSAINEARRELIICNSCRYCEGYCDVWDAIERKTEFSKNDIFHFSNLCHDCRECFYVCPFVEPHEYKLNIPKALSKVRQYSYQEFSTPKKMSWVYNKMSLLTLLLTIAAIAVLFSFFALSHGFSSFTGHYVGILQAIPISTFKVISIAIYVYVLSLWSVEGYLYWRAIKNDNSIKFSSILAAAWDVIWHKNFRGGSAGCNYPTEDSKKSRLYFHPLVFFGFIIDWVSIIFYPFTNNLVFWIYTVGSAMIFIGASSLLYMKLVSNKTLENLDMRKIDFPFTVLLLLAGLTGMVFPLLLSYPEWVIVFLLHDAFIFSIFILAPYSKFMHPIYRYISLIRNRIEDVKDIWNA
ncbi:hypothetical protein OXIME_000194 [Oxyplasma meridianum]|uniref:Tricarballylate utilization 4Fe-4S protein TcuB n=1 Tax=Oxyplasma meridianum TaxID=3073602 RepID=A0AAX4NEW4_9ARCH